LKKEPTRETVDAPTLDAIREGLKLAQNGKRWTVDEAFEFARKRG
jgi:hypothetical protein